MAATIYLDSFSLFLSFVFNLYDMMNYQRTENILGQTAASFFYFVFLDLGAGYWLHITFYNERWDIQNISKKIIAQYLIKNYHRSSNYSFAFLYVVFYLLAALSHATFEMHPQRLPSFLTTDELPFAAAEAMSAVVWIIYTTNKLDAKATARC